MAEHTFDKTVGYNDSVNNYAVPEEIVVTITLNEYRQLVANNATRQLQIDKAESDKYERNRKCEKLEAENKELKAELYALKKALDEKTEEEDVSPFIEEGEE